MTEIRPGDAAPAFRLPAPGNREFGLADFRSERHVVVAFYPFDWSPG